MPTSALHMFAEWMNEQIIEKYRLESVSEMLSSNVTELQRREVMISLEPQCQKMMLGLDLKHQDIS